VEISVTIAKAQNDTAADELAQEQIAHEAIGAKARWVDVRGIEEPRKIPASSRGERKSQGLAERHRIDRQPGLRAQ
jgi:hypothetical protein